MNRQDCAFWFIIIFGSICIFAFTWIFKKLMDDNGSNREKH